MSQDRRQLRRYVQRIPARFTCGAVQGEGYLRNLSKLGMFLRSDRLPAPRSEVQLVIEHPEKGKIELSGRVIWTTAELPNAKDVPPGFGVAVERDVRAYREFFESLLLT